MTDTPNTPAATVVSNATEDQFQNATGFTRFHASRVVGAVLAVIGGSMGDGLNPAQQLSGAINILGMAASEVIAGSSQTAEQRSDLIISLNNFVSKSSNDLAAEYEQRRQFAKFVQETVNSNEAAATPTVPVN